MKTLLKLTRRVPGVVIRATRSGWNVTLAVAFGFGGALSAQVQPSGFEPRRLTLEQASAWLESNLAAFTTLSIDSLDLDDETSAVSVSDCHMRFTRRSTKIVPPDRRFVVDVDLSAMHAVTVDWRWYPGPFPADGPVVVNLVWGFDEAVWLLTRTHFDAETLGQVVERAVELCKANSPNEIRPAA